LARLYIPVNNTLRMSRIQCICDLCADFEKLLQSKRTSTQEMFQCRPFQVFHNNKGAPVEITHFVDCADVREVQRRSGTRLTTETFDRLWVSGKFLGEKFYSYESPKICVFRLIYNTHSTAPEVFQDAVMRESLADKRLAAGHVERILG
jgi:hypothetical protein